MGDPTQLETLVEQLAIEATRDLPGLDDLAIMVRSTMSRPSTPPPPDANDSAVRPTSRSTASSHLAGPPLETAGDSAATLDEALRRAAQVPQKGTMYLARGSAPRFQSYAELANSAQRILGGLRRSGVQPGDPVILQLRDNQDIVTVFWACVLGGFVATPVGAAPTYDTPNEANRKLRNAWQLLGEPVIVADDTIAAGLAAATALWDRPEVRTLALSDLDGGAPDDDWYPARPETVVLNLFTSGSSGTPKCVQHTHATIAARTRSAAQARGYTADDVSLVWMPLDHITIAMFNVRDVFLQAMHINARTADFLEDPLSLLVWIDQYRVTNALGSNFAYALVNEALGDAERPLADLDLSCIREFINAGEGVDPAVSHRFLRLIGQYGAPPDAMTPAWGMSETCSAVTHTAQSRDDPSLGTVTVRRSSLGGDVVTAEPGDPDAVVLSTVGSLIPGVEMRIVDQDGRVLMCDQTGELQIRGVTMMHGYYGNPEANELADAGEGWFKTGDLAFVHDGELVIAGRIKDQIIVRGINFPAAELEAVVERVDGVRVPYAAAAAFLEPGARGERLVIFFVPDTWDEAALDSTLADIRSTLAREAGIAPDLTVPIDAADFPRTATGKIQRGALVAGLREGRLRPRPVRGADEPTAGETLFTTTWSAMGHRGHTDTTARTVFLGPRPLAEDCGLDSATVIETTGDPAGALDDAAALDGVDTVVLGWPLRIEENPDAFPRAQWLSEQYAATLGALEDRPRRGTRLLVLTSCAVPTGEAGPIDLGASALAGLTRTAAAESDTLRLSQLDLPADRSAWPSAIAAELGSSTPTGEVVAIRDGQRLARRLRPLPGPARAAAGSIRTGGCYVITGGLGGIGRKLSAHLLTEYRARLLILGRSQPTGEPAAVIDELSAKGDVRYRPLDVADADAVRTAVAEAEQEWDRRTDGIFHLAGHDPTRAATGPDGLALAGTRREHFATEYRAKIGGAEALGELLRDRADTTLVLFGSVNGEFGGSWFGPYAAANAFLAAFAEHGTHHLNRDVRCIGWTIWPGTGMSELLNPSAARQRAYLPIDAKKGAGLTETALSAGVPYALAGLNSEHRAVLDLIDPSYLVQTEAIVAYRGSTVDQDALRARVESALAEHQLRLVMHEVPSLRRNPDGTADPDEIWRAIEGRAHPDSADEGPRTDLERTTAAVFAEVLGRDTVGCTASFFELGGDSVRATRILRKLEERTGIRLSVRELYASPTAAGAAARIGERQAQDAGAAAASPVNQCS